LTEPTPLTIEAGPNQTVYFGYPPAECADIAWSGEGGGVPPYVIEWSDGGAQAHEVCPGILTTEYIVTITDLNNCVETDTVTICVIDVRCGHKLDKVEICHVPGGDVLKENTLCVAVDAVANHLAHGDMLAACGTDHSCPPALLDSKILDAGDNDDISVQTLDAFPNPFDKSTVIEFSSNATGSATVQLYNSLGLVAKLYTGPIEEGVKRQIHVDGSNLAPGIYFCVLQTEGHVISQKLVLER
jgi:hypothetical protein